MERQRKDIIMLRDETGRLMTAAVFVSRLQRSITVLKNHFRIRCDRKLC